MKTTRVFIDTNVIIKAHTGNLACRKCLDFLFKQPSLKLYTTSQAVIVFFSTLQNKRSTRPAFLKSEIIGFYKKLQPKIEVLDCTKQDIEKSLLIEGKDMEDNFQYTVGVKMKCTHFITENTKDFKGYDIIALKPKSVYSL